MHIKQVVIQGFKSFKEQTVLEPFDRRYNVVVGRNGSGKSNFFDAIQFVLSDEYSRLRSDQLQNLLHEGTGPRVISAYVEIVFDNQDGRLPIDKNKVSVRRLFSCKKDQYFLNSKLVSRPDVMSLLESAGFSKANPYYIVKQGKINQMTLASDSQRLKLLREVAGTRVFDDKCKESKKLLKQSESKLEKVGELLITIDERIQILEEEKQELKEYQQCDDKRRYLEFTIYERELKDNKKQLYGIELARAAMKPMQDKLTNRVKAAQEAVRSARKSLKEARKEVHTAEEERDVLSAEQQELLKEKTKLALMINDLREEVSGDKDSRKRAGQELAALKNEITAREEELERIKPEYEEIKDMEEECTRQLALKEQKRKELYAKQGRVSEFTTRSERDEWIRKKLDELERHINEKKDHQAKLTDELRNDAEKQRNLRRKVQDCTHEMKQQTDSIDNFVEQHEALTKAKDHSQALRKEQYRKESILQLEIDALKEDLRKTDNSLRSMVGNSILNGRDSVRKVIDTFSQREETAREISSYHGLLIDNFECDKSIYTAVEVTVGNRLFNHLIETDSFSTKILGEMNRQNLPGEASFMPLNRINVAPRKYPETKDAIPMIAKIVYQQMFDKVFRYVFGRTLLCRNLETASQLARSTGLDCVTIEGDQVSARGLLTGGYFNSARSKIDAQRTRTQLVLQIGKLEEEMTILKAEIMETDRIIVSYITEMQRAEIKNSKSKDNLELIKTEIRLTNAELATAERLRISKKQSLAQCASSLEAMTVTKEGYERELTQELSSQLSVEDQLQIDALNEDIRRIRQENKEAFTKRLGLEADKNKLENLLANNLVRRKDELVQALQDMSVEDRKRKLESFYARLQQVKNRLAKVNADLEAQTEKVSVAIERQKAEVSEMEKLKLTQKEVQERIDDNAKDLQKQATKQNIAQQKVNDLTRKMAQLEALPKHENFVNLTASSTQQLLEKIEKINKELKNYSHVNKRALEQFISFSDQKENLTKRSEELDIGAAKINELMMVLEQRKYAAIQFTFKQVSKFFSEVFEKLVPPGRAELVMQAINDEERGLGEAAGLCPEVIDSEKLSGIGIRVSFTGKKADVREMNQLSGGQKSLVALTLIFAIQKCDPAPFYLFDEIDQALDTQHRTAVADMIHELSENAQFITTTFRPELLIHANKFYGVKFRNKVSHVECVTLEEAADFLEDDTTPD